MKFYLSSYKLGNKVEKLKELINDKKLALIPNAADYHDEETILQKNNDGISLLKSYGIEAEILDLRKYFGKKEELKKKLKEYGGVFVRGGNTFILRQAMKLSGFDDIIKEINEISKMNDFVYSGYSAGICILAPTLEDLQIVDNPKIYPYKEIKETIWEGLGILDYMIFPHYKSDHPEAQDIDKEVELCRKKDKPFKTLRDGDVIIID